MKWLACAALVATVARAASPPFSLSIETRWPAPPLELEILETLYDENPHAYFSLLKLLTKHALVIGPDATPKAVLESALDLIDSHGLFPLPTQRDTFELALALHTAAPRIEAAYSAYSRIDEVALGVANCSSWVEWKGKGFCDAEQLRQDIERGIDAGTHSTEKRRGHPGLFDRVLPSRSETGPQAIFYYSPTPDAVPLLEYLDEHARAYPAFQYVVRYRAPTAERTSHTPLTGYGVEMALKKTDYLVVDDRATSQRASSQAAFSASNATDPFAHILGNDPWAESINGLKEEELKDLGLRAVQLIKESADPLDAFVHLSQDLPKYAAALGRSDKITIPAKMRARAHRLSGKHPIGPAFFLNGRSLKEHEVNAFGLLNAVRAERHNMVSLMSLGFTPEQAFTLISDPLIGQSQTEVDPLEGLVDASDRPENSKVIVYLNNIATDPQYAQWPHHIHSYLRPVYPGQLHLVRRNTFNVILVLDLGTVNGVETVLGPILTMVQRNVPLRVGIVPMFDSIDEPSAVIGKLFMGLSEAYGPSGGIEFLQALIPMKALGTLQSQELTLDDARAAYARLVEASSDDLPDYDELVSRSGLNEYLENVQTYAERLAATRAESPSGHIFINGKHLRRAGQWTSLLQQELGGQLNHIQSVLMQGASIDADTIDTYFYDIPTTSKRRNKVIVPTDAAPLRTFNLLDVFTDEPNAMTSVFFKQFVYPADKTAGTPLSLWVVGDLDTLEGLKMVQTALIHLEAEQCSTRVGFVHVPPESPSSAPGPRLSTLLYQLLSSNRLNEIEPTELLALVTEFSGAKDNLVDTGRVTADADRDGLVDEPPLNSFTSEGWSVTDEADAAEFWRLGSAVADKLKLTGPGPYLLLNGRLLGPVTSAELGPEDMNTLEGYELRKRIHPVIDMTKTFFDDLTVSTREALGNLIAIASSVVAHAYMPQDAEGIFLPTPASRSRVYEQLDDGELSFTVGEPKTALLHIAVIIDPISENAQKWSGLLDLLSDIDHVALSVYFDPNTELSELKVKRFYRSALRSSISFDAEGNEVAPGVIFNDLPGKPILTLGMDVPHPWIVRPKESPLDLDNLVLGTLREPTHVLFNLEKLVVDGHAREATNVPPRGLQIQLKHGDEVVSDTQVMANLGYFQLKATPGVYQLAIRPGRGTEVYELVSVGAEGWDSPSVNVTGPDVSASSFDGTLLFPRFQRRAGMEEADVLQVPEPAENLGSKIKGLFGLKPAKAPAASRHADINIFTVASGLLYERFASIMILSVMKHTKSSVKFWFIENFLSPTFIKFLPHFAKEYGFDYELVTYKWPSWLRAQTEKQRIIWAYKILFLDVLFPMDLDKVVFVDADQIVRVDMAELNAVDLHGRVYGYPPMGDDRTEMEGFRFWKTGYWAKELQGRPYHISALYVVDLKRFRQLAAGDRLRGQYHALSADPNSLANLDQDLPNSMQSTIPIFTLNQDWLWCQTWCSDESLATAKTIDLCQNPLTKEPKLVRARQIPEWDTYDREIAAFAATLAADGGALAANVDDLAGEPGAGAGAGGADAAADAQEPAAQADSGADEEPRHDEL